MANNVDPDQMKELGYKVWSYKMGELVSLMIHFGDSLGIYSAMAGKGPLTSTQVAETAGLSERVVREWLLGQAAAGLVDRSPDGQFELNAAQAAFLANESDSIVFAGGAFGGGTPTETVEALADSFRTGRGITYEQQGPSRAASLARMTGPWSRLALVDLILPALDGVVDKLEAGATVIDVGCGGGVTAITIAKAFPASTVTGYDPSQTAIDLARSNAEGVDNVSFEVAAGESIDPDASVDLAITFDCLHDMARPDQTSAAIHQAVAPEGTWLVKEIRSSGSFEKNLRNPMLAMLYGYSISSCLQSSLSQPDGLGLGTVGLHPEAMEDLVKAAGFSTIKKHDFEDPSNLYYEIRNI